MRESAEGKLSRGRRWSGLVAGSSALLLILAACGSDNSSGSGAAETTAAPATTTATTAAGGATTTAASGGGAATTAAAGAQDWDAVLAAAKKEGKVTLYWSNPIDEAALTDAWKKAHPDIELTILRAATGELVPRLAQEQQGNLEGADVVSLSDRAWFETEAKQEGALTPLELDSSTASTWAGLPAFHDNWVELFGGNYYVGFNTDIVQPFTDPSKMLDPSNSGKVGVLDLASPTVMAQYQVWQDKLGSDFLQKLAALKPTIYPSTVSMAQALGAGEIGLAVIGTPGAFEPLIAQGAPIKYEKQDQAVTAFTFGAAQVGWSKHPNAGAVLMDWLMSNEGYTELVKASGGKVATPLTGIPDTISYDGLVIYNPSDWPKDKQASFKASWDAMFRS